MEVVEGDARLSVLLATDTMVLAAKTVSGKEQDEVFALDPRTRTVKWRINAKHVRDAALVDEANAFYMISDHHLQKRDIQTGGLVWSTRLDSIPQQKTPPRVTIKDRWANLLDTVGLRRSPKTLSLTFGGFGGTPNSYLYQPVLSGSTLALFREATRGSGCIVTHCFSDWLEFDRKTGRLISGGSGNLLGDGGGTAVFEDQSAIWSLKDGRAVEVDFPQGTGAYPVRNSLRSSGRDQFSWSGRLIFCQSDGSVEQTCLFDAGKVQAVAVGAPVPSDFQVNWVLLDHHLLRYSECMACSENEKRSGQPWFELYNLKGDFIARAESKSMNESWYFSYLGVTRKGQVLFKNGDQRLVVEIPSLRLTSFLDPRQAARSGSDPYTYASSYMARGASRFYVTQGNTSIFKMTGKELPHRLRILAMDAETNQALWEHIEHVTIRKISSP